MNIRDQFVPLRGMIAVQLRGRVWCFRKEHVVDLFRRLMPNLNALDNVNFASTIGDHVVINKERYFELIAELYPKIVAAIRNTNDFALPYYDFEDADARQFIGAFLDGYYYSFYTISWNDGADIRGNRIFNVAVRRPPSLLQKYVTKSQGNIIYEINFMDSDIKSLVGYSFNFHLKMQNGRIFCFGDNGTVREIFS